MVSTQPELPVRCCTTQAPAISAASATAIPASASRYTAVMKNPVVPRTSNAAKYVRSKSGFSRGSANV